MPNTFTPVAITLVAGVPFLNGDFEPHEAMQPSSACCSVAACAPNAAARRMEASAGRNMGLLLA